jgi:hypothetical protein
MIDIKRILVASGAAVALAGLGACAQMPAEAQAAEADGKIERVYVTGSRISVDPDTIRVSRIPTTGQNVVIYTREDLESTGEWDIRRALRQLSPIVY